jgi:sulfate adenylyltransferase
VTQPSPPEPAGLSAAAADEVVAETAAAVAGVLPDGLASLPAVHATGAVLDLVDLVVAGVVDQGFVLPGSATADAATVAVPLPLGPEVTAGPGDRVVLEDDEGVPVALVDVTETSRGGLDGSLVAGAVTPLRPVTHGPFRRLRLTPDELPAAVPDAGLVVTTTRPLTSEELATATADADGRPVVVLALVGTGRAPYPTPAGLVRALRASLLELPDASLVVPVPLPAALDDDADLAARASVARTYVPAAAATHLRGAPHGDLDWLVEEGTGFPRESLGVLRAHRRPLPERGVVVLFSGLSGSGKSTLARGLAEALEESSDRTVTLLDGDVVRRHLSKGLGFSRADRDTNVRRIGFVAAEVARHGGVALCAPIAPYAATRAAVRAMVDDAGGVFVLVHVSTPLAVCEARDRKGLYARARAGQLPEFTGISDPYEEPTDADLTLDTSVLEVDAGVEAVLGLLRARELVRSEVEEV